MSLAVKLGVTAEKIGQRRIYFFNSGYFNSTADISEGRRISKKLVMVCSILYPFFHQNNVNSRLVTTFGLYLPTPDAQNP